MGSDEGEPEEKPVHLVTVNSFYLAKHELTFDEYDAFCTATGRDKPDDSGWGRDQRPVIFVSWYDAVEYCNWRSQQDGRKSAYTIDKNHEDPNNNSFDPLKWVVNLDSSANGYRLPTEAEWEFAAREGGKKVHFGNGKDVIDAAEINFEGSSNFQTTYTVVGEFRQKTVPVTDLSANALGLKNMSGNVFEWCWDWYCTYPGNAGNDSTEPSKGTSRTLRGGAWDATPQACRVTRRGNVPPQYLNNNVGFRLAVSLL